MILFVLLFENERSTVAERTGSSSVRTEAKNDGNVVTLSATPLMGWGSQSCHQDFRVYKKHK